MKRITAIVIVIVLGSMVLYFSPRQQPTTHAGSIEKITIGNTVGHPNLAIIAEEKGYFKANGLDVSFKDYEKPMVKDLIDGKIDIVSATAEFVVVRNSFAGEDLKILAAISKQNNQWEVVARRDKNIQSAADLKGKRIAVQRGTAGEFFLAEFLLFNNLRMNDISVVDLALPERMEQISSGELDAVVMISPYTQQLKKTLGKEAISWPAQAGGNVFSLSYATGQFAAKHPDIIERYLRALVQAEIFVNTNEAEARTIIQRKLHFTESDIQALWPLFTFEVELEQELLLAMEEEARWTIRNNLTDQKKVPYYLDFIYFDGLKKVKPEAVTIIH
jgi:NitT/TauT family transport system substrate-binding protein